MGRGFEFYLEPFTVRYDFEKGFSWAFDSGPEEESRDNELVASEKRVRDYLTEYGVENITSVKLVETKNPTVNQGCDIMLRSFAENAFEEVHYVADSFRKQLVEYCGVGIEYQRCKDK